MAILGALLGANQKAASYSIAGRNAYNQGLRQKVQKYSEANAAALQATSELSSAGRNMMTARANQNMELGSARAAQAASGFDATSGTGGGIERRTQQITDAGIDVMSKAASDKANSLYNQAMTARNAGDSALRLGERTNEIYSKMAKASKTAGWIEAGIDAALAIATGGASLKVTEKQNQQNEDFNKKYGLEPGKDGYRERIDPYRQAFMIGMNNTNGNDALSTLLQQYGFIGSANK